MATIDVRTKVNVMAVAQPGDLLFWGDRGLHGTLRFTLTVFNMWQ
ncbi:hypothetical protein [Weissella cibaria]|nr:hypothetical protein [Weissella cibaria]